MRYPVMLSEEEKHISRTISEAFKLTVCGFDLIRGNNGKSYVCDVNGFQLTKQINYFYDHGLGSN